MCRCEGVLKVEDALTGLKVIEYEGNQIRLSLRTYIPETDLPEQNHELAIELLDGTLELRNAEVFSFMSFNKQNGFFLLYLHHLMFYDFWCLFFQIFPNDVYIGEAIEAAKSFA